MNPYKMSTGEGLLAGFASAIPSAIQGYRDIKADDLKQKEVEARIEAQADNQKWKKVANKMQAEQAGYGLIENSLGDYELQRKEGFLDPAKKQQLDYFAKGVQYDPESGPVLADWKKAETAKTKLKDDPTIKISSDVRKEFQGLPEVKKAREVETAFRKVRSAGESKSAAGDLSMIFNYMKMLDPGSVVRESEFKSAEQAKSWLSRADDEGVYVPGFVRTSIQKADPTKKGAFLLPEQRQDFLDNASKLYGDQYAQYGAQRDYYRKLAEDYGVDPEMVTGSGLLDPKELQQQQQQQSVDPQVQSYASQYGIPYEQAQQIIERRKQQQNVNRTPQSVDKGLLGI